MSQSLRTGPVFCRLLRRPAPALTFAASQGASSGRELHPMATALMNQLGLHRHQASQLGMFASDRVRPPPPLPPHPHPPRNVLSMPQDAGSRGMHANLSAVGLSSSDYALMTI